MKEKKLAVKAMMNTVKDVLSAKGNHSVKKEVSDVVMTTVMNIVTESLSAKREVSDVVTTTVMNIVTESLSENTLKMMKNRQDAVFQEETMTTVKTVNLSARNLSAANSTVTRNVRVADAAATAERKIRNTTARKPQARSVSTNILPIQAFAHAARPTTSSSPEP